MTLLTSRPLSLLVVDDSPHLRKTLAAFLAREYPAARVDVAANGQVGLRKALAEPYDLVTLDLSMPIMDGYTFLRLFRAKSAVPVLIVSALSDVEHVEKALELGANGFLAKPLDPYRGLADIEEEFRVKLVTLLGGKRLGHPLGKGVWQPEAQDAPVLPTPLSVFREDPRAPSGFPVAVVGCSSGGPPTVQYLLSGLPRDMAGAMVIAQHMPRGFTQALTERLDRLLPVTVREALDGEPLRAGEVVFCPGGANTTLRAAGENVFFSVTPAPEGALVPSVDELFSSAADVLGSRVLGVVLTGMGRDGTEGVRRIKAQGGRVIAESEETAVIYGMPKQAAATGCVDAQLALPAISVALIRALARPS